MKLFRSVATATDVSPNWASDLISEGILPSFGGGYVGIGALRNSDVLTAVSIIAGDIARFPVILTDRITGTVINLENVEYLMNTKVNDRLSAYQWKFSMAVNAILSGNSYSRIVRDPLTSEPAMFEFYAPSQTQVDYTDPTKIIYRFTPYNSGTTKICTASDVVHWKFFSYDTIMGRSPLLSLGNEMDLQESGISTLQKFFNDGFKGSILKAKGKLSAKARRKIRTDFEDAQTGATAGAPIVVDETMEYQPLEVDTNVLNLISSNNYSTSQIAKALRVPAYRLAQNSPNQSVKQLSDDYVQNNLPFYFRPITTEFEMKLLDDDQRHKYAVLFDTSEVAGMSVDDVVKLKSNGVIVGDEARAKIGLKATGDPDMQKFETNLNTIFLDQRDAYISATKGGDSNASKNKGNQNDDDTDGSAGSDNGQASND
ncbi:phage portal protein [Loigolactobacillus bifermentans]|uniref:Phage-related portal protein n=1 Tax=Loigolactobacillus bifermentans DSM 20003 TaxID=1423726 RepID=A0A0R1HA17_9LACO|nr:phage portal protein [Loigolactobacillus bifermentans]KRK40900.1 phage-related portal protein [Loigolactobacillus bifermentans DSM 20003]QGG59651.1 phage portal protein [Loigolactobacillus bifermentans]